MLDKLVKHLKRNWGVYSWVLGIGSCLFLLFLFLLLSTAPEGRKPLSPLLRFMALALVFLWLFDLVLYGAFHLFTKFFQWLSVSHLCALARELGSREFQKCNNALNALLKMGKKAVPIFTEILSAMPAELELVDWNGREARRLAVKGLGMLKAKEGFDAIVRVLDDPDEVLRKEAIWALGRIGDQRAIPILLPLMGEPLPICELVRSALRELGVGKIVDAWHKVLKHRSKTALANLRTYRSEIIEALFKGLERNVFSEDVAVNAVWALSELGTVEIILRLRSLALHHPKGEVRDACLQAIDKLTLISRLPRPATSSKSDTSTLPRPAIPHEIDTSTLPAVPSDK